MCKKYFFSVALLFIFLEFSQTQIFTPNLNVTFRYLEAKWASFRQKFLNDKHISEKHLQFDISSKIVLDAQLPIFKISTAEHK